MLAVLVHKGVCMTKDKYYIGQIFEKEYPIDCAIWCNNNNYSIVEIEKENGVRRYQIQESILPRKEVLLFEKQKLLSKLQDLDYIGIKIAMGRATRDDYVEEIELANKLAKQVNEIDEELASGC